jgi:hypothetical protein
MPDAPLRPTLLPDLFPDAFLLAPPPLLLRPLAPPPFDEADLPEEALFAPELLPPPPPPFEEDAPFAPPPLRLPEPDDFLLDFLAGIDLPS